MYQYEQCFVQEIEAFINEIEKTSDLNEAQLLWQAQCLINKKVDAILLKPQYIQAQAYYKTISYDYLSDFSARHSTPVMRL